VCENVFLYVIVSYKTLIIFVVVGEKRSSKGKKGGNGAPGKKKLYKLRETFLYSKEMNNVKKKRIVAENAHFVLQEREKEEMF
jgi:hypothetical protein